MLYYVRLYVFLIKAAFALQIPRQAAVSYTNSSTSVTAAASTATGPDCCEVYAAGVFLNWWYTGHNVSVNNGTLITEYMKYNGTCSHAFSHIATTNVDSRAMFNGKTRTVPLHRMRFKFICPLRSKLC